jgi:hypothetical protein
MSSSTDPRTGGSLADMAPRGTKMPNDAGQQNLLPSVPRADQMSEHNQFDYQGQGQPTLAFAADNATDVPRSTRDIGATGDVITEIGSTAPAEVEAKRLNLLANDPAAKGSIRNEKHGVKNRSRFDKLAAENAEDEQRITEPQQRI